MVTLAYLCSPGKPPSFIPHGSGASDGSLRLWGEVPVPDSFRELLELELQRAP